MVTGGKGADVIHRILVQSGQPDPAGRRGDASNDLGEGVERLAAVVSDDSVDPQGGVRVVTNDDPTGVQQCAEALVCRDPLGEPREVGRGRLAQVPLDPEVAEERCACAEVQQMPAACGVRDIRPDVAPDQLPGDQGGRPALDLLSFQRIDAVRGPDPVGSLEDGEVDPAAAGGAGLDLDPGVPSVQLVDQGVGGEGLGVN